MLKVAVYMLGLGAGMMEKPILFRKYKTTSQASTTGRLTPHWPIPYCSKALDSYAAGKGPFRLHLDWDRHLIVESTIGNLSKQTTGLEKPGDP